MAAGDEELGQRAGHQQAIGVLVDAAIGSLAKPKIGSIRIFV
jgi:hypothetical protein